jgi:autotransporter-associated beta strand protein
MKIPFHTAALCLCAGLVTGATAGTSTWTRDSAATQTWTAPGNWAGGAVYQDPGTSADILTFYNDTTTALANGVNSITTSVPSALMMNVLTLNGRGATSGASNIVIATNASTWTLGGSSPAVNLNGVNGTAPLDYTVAPNLVLGANTAFTGAGTATFHFSGNISGGFSLAKSGASALTLSGSNDYSGGTTVAGTLVLKNASAGGTGNINFSGTPGNSPVLKLDGTGGNILLTNSLTNNGGTLVNVAGNNKVTSQLSINSGATNSVIQVDGGTLECAGNYIAGQTGRNLFLQGNGNGLYSGNLVFGGNTLQKSGLGTWTLTGANTYTRDTIVNNGTLKLDATGSLKFVPFSNGVCNKITGPGTAILNGTFNIDLSGVDKTPGNTWTLVNVSNRSGSLAGITTTPALAFTQSSGVWTARDGSSIWQYAEATGVLSLTADSTGHASWITVDPTEPLTDSWSSEWNTDGNLDGWTGVGTSAEVSAGMVSGTATTTAPRIEWTDFAAGPDLDLGYNDFVEVRIQVPDTYEGPIRIFYGTTLNPGVSTARVLTIPAASIPKDGAFHTYRISVGLEPNWRSTLRDLRIDPVGGAGTVGMAFAVDYIRIGDLPGDVYLPNTTDQPVTAYELSSKRFRFIWDANRATNNGINETIARGCLRNAEEAWQVYVNLLGYREPAESTDPGQRDGNKYKVNFLCTFDGFWMGGSPTSFGYLNIAPGGLQVDPPSWVIPHELMHVFQMHNTSGHVPGEWWETHANYGRERWLYHYANLYPNTSNLEAQAVRDAHLMMSSGRNYYLTWLPFLYVDENPDALPDLYDGLVAKMWQETQAGEFPMMALDRLTPTTSLKDIVGYYARRGATFDYAQQATINATLNNQDPTRNARHLFTDLVRRADDPTWWRVPMDKAPAQGAYAIHQLVPAGSGAGRVVTVNLHGLADAARGADWRASFIAVSDTGVERYTPLWSTGSSSITLAEDENTLYLSVAGTPDIFHYGGHDEALYPFRSHPSRSRFHYEVQVTGATPRERNNGATTGLVQHANGGGWKASTATVDATAFIGPNARVLGAAQVRNTARIEDFAVVQDNAQVLNNAIVERPRVGARLRRRPGVRPSARLGHRRWRHDLRKWPRARTCDGERQRDRQCGGERKRDFLRRHAQRQRGRRWRLLVQQVDLQRRDHRPSALGRHSGQLHPRDARLAVCGLRLRDGARLARARCKRRHRWLRDRLAELGPSGCEAKRVPEFQRHGSIRCA